MLDRPLRHRRLTAGVGLGVVALLALLGWVADLSAVVDLVRSNWVWMLAHAALGWSLALGLVATVVVLGGVLTYQHRAAGKDLVAVGDELALSAAETVRLTVERDGPRPSDRDRQLAAEVMTIWDPRGDPFNFLEVSFDAKRWHGKDVEDLRTFRYEYKHRFFDDAEVQAAFQELQTAVDDLTKWIMVNGHVEGDAGGEITDGDPFTYGVPSGDELGWPEYDSMRREDELAACRVLEVSREFERVARSRSL